MSSKTKTAPIAGPFALPDLAELQPMLAELAQATAEFHRSSEPPEALMRERSALQGELAEIDEEKAEITLRGASGPKADRLPALRSRAAEIEARLEEISAAFMHIPRHREQLRERLSALSNEISHAAESLLADLKREAAQAAVDAFRRLQGAICIHSACSLESILPIVPPLEVRTQVRALDEVGRELAPRYRDIVDQIEKVRRPVKLADMATARL